jgi:hypothetical protein
MMAASKPTSWLSSRLHILKSTELRLGTLADGLGCFPFDDEAYPPPSDSRDTAYGIRSLTRVGIPVRTLSEPVLYPHRLKHEAIPKYISERTSYH